MKTAGMFLVMMAALIAFTGCTRIVEVTPKSGPPGMPVYVQSTGMFGDPTRQCLKWDGEVLCRPFPECFTVPAVSEGGTPGAHKVTLVDELDLDEASLVFPLFRARRHSITFIVTEP